MEGPVPIQCGVSYLVGKRGRAQIGGLDAKAIGEKLGELLPARFVRGEGKDAHAMTSCSNQAATMLRKRFGSHSITRTTS